MPATDTDPDFAQAAAAFSRRRTWPQLLEMVLGGCVALTGIASVAAHLIHRDEHLALPMGQAVGLYLAGAIVFAWGGSRGDSVALLKWLAISVLSGSLFIVLAVLTNVLPTLAGGVIDRLFGRRDRGPDTLATLVVDRDDAEALVGTPAKLSHVRSPARSATAVWEGPSAEPTQAPYLTVNVKRSAALAAKVRTKDVRPPITRVPDVGDGCVIARRDAGGRELVSVQASRGDWVVAVGLNSIPTTDPAPALLAHATRALDRLAHALP